jgi:lipoprotein-anchoring transpeptidase ErfK/SrfK
VSPRRSRKALAATSLAVVAALALTACTVAKASTPSASGSVSGLPGSSSASPSPTTPSVALDVLAVQPFDAPSTVTASGGQLTTVSVTRHGKSGTLAGHVDTAGTEWASKGLPVEGATYDVKATVSDASGTSHQLTASFSVARRTSGSTVNYTVTPGDDWDVGVYAPLVLRFYSKITDRAAVERALTVESSKPVTGAWSWINSSEVHFRPKVSWPTHTTIRLVAALKNVRVGPSKWGARSTTITVKTGDSHVAKVDGKKHTFTVYKNGKLWAKWPTSLGRPEFVTRSGSYIVLEKKPMIEMTSCSVHIACDPKDPNWYDLKVMQDVRLTWSGTFVHAAPWSVSHQGFANVSHGCINLSTSRATSFYNLVTYGDMVTVVHTNRGPQDLIDKGDPGMTDWNTSFTTWVQGSALKAAIITSPLA